MTPTDALGDLDVQLVHRALRTDVLRGGTAAYMHDVTELTAGLSRQELVRLLAKLAMLGRALANVLPDDEVVGLLAAHAALATRTD